MSKVICINSDKFILPEGMSTKDIQALAGFLITLQTVSSEYNYEHGEYMHYAGRGAEVKLEEIELLTKAEAMSRGRQTRDAYEAKRAAEKATEQ